MVYRGSHKFRLWGLGFRGMWGQGLGFKDTTLQNSEIMYGLNSEAYITL